MKKLSTALALAALLGTAACTQPQNTLRPTDTGNMAFPTPVPTGNVGRTNTSTSTMPDTGNMAYPTPQPSGNLGRTNTR